MELGRSGSENVDVGIKIYNESFLGKALEDSSELRSSSSIINSITRFENPHSRPIHILVFEAVRTKGCGQGGMPP